MTTCSNRGSDQPYFYVLHTAFGLLHLGSV